MYADEDFAVAITMINQYMIFFSTFFLCFIYFKRLLPFCAIYGPAKTLEAGSVKAMQQSGFLCFLVRRVCQWAIQYAVLITGCWSGLARRQPR